MTLEPGFIETVDFSKFTLYSDTDSAYSLIPIPFDKFEDQNATADYVQNIASDLNTAYIDLFNKTIVKFGNVSPDYNFMDFKSEIVAYRGFFNTKKNYGLAKFWDEGSFYDPAEIKKVGGQISKADSTPIVLDLLIEIYQTLLLDFSITTEIELYQKIFVEIKNKYLLRVEQAVANFDVHEFGIPKKWSLKTLKSIPNQVKGAMLYNYLFNDNFRPGESILQTQVIVNPSILLQTMQENKPSSEFQMQSDMVSSKTNTLSFPVEFMGKDKEKAQEIFQKMNMRFDLKTIIDFNVNMKIDSFQKLFSDETIRLAI